jgi:hypothetical protein
MRGDDADSEEIRAEFRAEGWDGRCRIWHTQRCNKGGCRKDGGMEIGTPITAPTAKMRPMGWRPEDRVIRTCPERLPMRYTSALRRWADWRRFGSLPEPGCVGEQDDWTVSAMTTLEAEAALIELAQTEERMQRDG